MNRLTKIVLIVLGIIVLIGILVGAYFLGKGKSSPTAKPADDSGSTAKPNTQPAPSGTAPNSSPSSTPDSAPKPPVPGGTTDSAGGSKGPSTNINSQQNPAPPK